MHVSEAEPVTFGDVFCMVVVTVNVKDAGADAVTVTVPDITHVAVPESLIPATDPFDVALVRPSVCVRVLL
jgi:hypothetical protein